MIPENETSMELAEITLELLEKVPSFLKVKREIPGMAPSETRSQITKVRPDDYNEAVNNLMEKYTQK
jgi:hypothetical protein